MLLETFFPLLLLCLENDSMAHADLSLLVIPGPASASSPHSPQSKGGGALMEAKGRPGLAVSWDGPGGWSSVFGQACWCGLRAATRPGRDFPEHPASVSLGPASSLAPKQEGNHVVR